MKKLLQLLLISCLTLGVISCGKDDPLGTVSSSDGGGDVGGDNGNDDDNITSSISLEQTQVPDSISSDNNFYYLMKPIYKKGEKAVFFVEQRIKDEIEENENSTPSLGRAVGICESVYRISPKNIFAKNSIIDSYKIVENSATSMEDFYGVTGSGKEYRLKISYIIGDFWTSIDLKIYVAIIDKYNNIIAKSKSFTYTYNRQQ